MPWYVWCALAGIMSVMIGVQWDISWHVSIGRDTFWTPAHIAMLASGPFDNWWHDAYGLDVKIISPASHSAVYRHIWRADRHLDFHGKPAEQSDRGFAQTVSRLVFVRLFSAPGDGTSSDLRIHRSAVSPYVSGLHRNRAFHFGDWSASHVGEPIFAGQQRSSAAFARYTESDSFWCCRPSRLSQNLGLFFIG